MDRTGTQQVSIFGLSQPRLYEIMQQQGMAKFRADQLLDWIYRRHVTDLQQMQLRVNCIEYLHQFSPMILVLNIYPLSDKLLI